MTKMLKWQSSLMGWKGMICHNHFVGFRVIGGVDCSIDIFLIWMVLEFSLKDTVVTHLK
jgi:hypothetical protein